MFAVKVYGVPESVDHEATISMIDPLRFAVASASSLVSVQRVFVFFVPDMVQDGLGEELYVEISGLDELLWSNSQRDKAAENVAQALEAFVKANIPQCREICVRPALLSGSLVGCVNKYILSR